MKAVVYEKYGTTSELIIRNLERPVPKENEVLIKVHSVSLNASDIVLLKGSPFVIRFSGYGLFKPKYNILGSDISGTVEEVGTLIDNFKIGDEVFADLAACGLGGLAEYVCVHHKYLVEKPKNISHQDAAAAPMASVTAFQGLKKGDIKPNQKVLINGASGGVGSFLIQIAKAMGAEVTAVCSSRNVDAAKLLGADYVIDYTKEDFTNNNKKYDLIIGANGYHPIKNYKKSLSENGRYIMTGGSGAQIFEAMLFGSFMSRKGGKKLGNLAAKPNKEDLGYIKQLYETGKIKSTVDKCFVLDETPEAFKYIIEKKAKGKVVISMI